MELNSQFEISLALPVRDMIQSLGIKGRMDHPALLKLFEQSISAFNADTTSPVKIVTLETPSGALPQFAMQAGQPVLESMRAIDRVLPKDIAARPLVRGPYGVAVHALHQDDLKFVLEAIAEASGATRGRKVIFRLFEAQNNVAEHVATLKILSELNKQGYNVKVQTEICYTANEALDIDYYRQLAKAVQENARMIDSDIYEGTGFKDMIGMMRGTGAASDAENSAILTKSLAEATFAHSNEATIALHNHQQGTATALIDAAQALNAWMGEEGNADKKLRFVMDVMPGGRGNFPDLEKVVTGIGLTLSDGQKECLDEMVKQLDAFADFYAYASPKKSGKKLWTDAQCAYAFIPGGATASDEKDNVNPLAQHLVDSKKIADFDIAKRFVADLFVHVHRQIAIDCGNVHSVTPGAYHLAALTTDVINGMIDDGFIDKAISSNLDCSSITSDANYASIQEAVADIPKHYRHLNNQLAVKYFRSKMPRDANPELFKIICERHLRYTLRDDYTTSPLARIVAPEQYEAVRSALFSNPTDKNAAKRILTEAAELRLVKIETQRRQRTDRKGVSPSHLIHESIDKFVKLHVGQNKFLYDANTKPVTPIAKELVKKLQAEGRLKIPFKDAVMLAIIYGHEGIMYKGGQPVLNRGVIKGCTEPSALFPTYWPANDRVSMAPDGTPKNAHENRIIETLIANKAPDLEALDKTNPELAAQLYGEAVRSNKFRYPYILEAYENKHVPQHSDDVRRHRVHGWAGVVAVPEFSSVPFPDFRKGSRSSSNSTGAVHPAGQKLLEAHS